VTVRAIWQGQVIAESGETITVEGNHYFPPASLRHEHLVPNTRRSRCGWKGEARYFDVVVDGLSNPAAAWSYADPKPAAEAIRDYVAFWGGIEVVE
jgi:uncharacterized protein (DUF427 family)